MCAEKAPFSQEEIDTMRSDLEKLEPLNTSRQIRDSAERCSALVRQMDQEGISEEERDRLGDALQAEVENGTKLTERMRQLVQRG